MAYASASDVSALTPTFLSGSSASTFTSNTCPTLTQINGWLSNGSAIIDTKLASKGYDPIASTSGAYEFAKQANALYAAWFAERTLESSRVSKMENTRASTFKQDFLDMLEMLISLDLSQMGVTRGKKPPADYAGGIDKSDKEITESDTDRVLPRFGRGQFDNIEAGKPDVRNANEQTRKDN